MHGKGHMYLFLHINNCGILNIDFIDVTNWIYLFEHWHHWMLSMRSGPMFGLIIYDLNTEFIISRDIKIIIFILNS